jgi:transposase InsO family protein
VDAGKRAAWTTQEALQGDHGFQAHTAGGAEPADQNFATERPDQVWTADITYIATGEGWLYLAIVLDLFTRQIVGWAMRERMTKDLVIDALRMASFRRRPQPGLIHHSATRRSLSHSPAARSSDRSRCR